MKKTNKIIVALCIILTMITLCTTVFAELKPTDLTGTDVNIGGLQTLGQKIVGVVQTIGVVVAVVILLVLGIKYIMGSAEEKADYKKSMIPYIVGAILIFASTTVVNIVYNMAKALNDTTT